MNVKVRGVDSYLYLSVQSDLSPSSTFLILSSGTVKGLLGNMGGNNSESGYNIYGYLISLLAIVIVRRYDSNHLLRAQDIAQKVMIMKRIEMIFVIIPISYHSNL